MVQSSLWNFNYSFGGTILEMEKVNQMGDECTGDIDGWKLCAEPRSWTMADLMGDAYSFRRVNLVSDMRSAILRVDTIETSSRYRCIERFYIGTKDGNDYLWMQFHPIITYRTLLEEGSDLSNIEEFVSDNDIEIILFNVENHSDDEKVCVAICEKLKIQYLNINEYSTNYIPIIQNCYGKMVMVNERGDDISDLCNNLKVLWANEAV